MGDQRRASSGNGHGCGNHHRESPDTSTESNPDTLRGAHVHAITFPYRHIVPVTSTGALSITFAEPHPKPHLHSSAIDDPSADPDADYHFYETSGCAVAANPTALIGTHRLCLLVW